MKTLITIGIIIYILHSVTMLNAQNTIVNISNSYQNHFGWDISGYGDYCCVSDPRDSINDFGNGAVLIYKKNGANWNFLQKISATVKSPYQLFGYCVSMNKKHLAISELGNNTKGFMAGKVSIYELQNNSWFHIQDLLPDTSKDMIYFGETVKLFDNKLYIGAPNLDSGCVFVYEFQGNKYVQTQKIPAPYRIDFEFGKTINVNPDFLFIGAPATGNSLINGGVFVYQVKNNKWELDTFFRENINESSSHFGESMASQGNILMIGAPHSTVNNGTEDYFYAGAVYMATYNNQHWAFNPNPITSSNIGGQDLFGSSIALKDSILFVSSPRQDNTNRDDGSIEIFELATNGWISDTVYYSPNNDIYFGNNIFVFNDNLMVTTGGEKQQKNKGLIYIYRIDKLISGMEETEKSDYSVQFYPNPANNYLVINTTPDQVFNYQIYSMQAKLLSSAQISSGEKIDISMFPSGIYMISLQFEDRVFTKQFSIIH